MNKFLVLVASSVALLIGANANAADLYGGRGSVKDYDYVPVQTQHRVYLRVDGGYAIDTAPAMGEGSQWYLGNTSWENTWTVGGGVGVYITPSVRADVTYDHRFDSDMSGFLGVAAPGPFGIHKFGLSSDVILANLYYDFNAVGQFRPYVGVGIGAVDNHAHSSSVRVGCGCTYTFTSADNWDLAAALMAGFTVKLHDRWSLDAGYRYLYMGDAKTGATYDEHGVYQNSGIEARDLDAHEFRVGLRWDIR